MHAAPVSQMLLLVDRMHLAELDSFFVFIFQCSSVFFSELHIPRSKVPEPVGFAVQAVNEVKARSKVMGASVLHEGLMHQPTSAATSKVSHLCLTA